MDLHVRGVSGADRTQPANRNQPIRLKPLRVEPAKPVEGPGPLRPLTKPTPGPFQYEEGGFFLAGQTEVDAEGRGRVRGTATFQQGRVQLKADGTFQLGYDDLGKTLEGDGEFSWRDRIGGLLTGKGNVTVRYDHHGNTIVQLAGLLKTRHRTLELDGPGEAEVDVRNTGAYIVRLKGRTEVDRGVANLTGDVALTYGEVEGDPIDAVAVWGQAHTETDYVETEGEGHYLQRRAYGPSNTVMTVSGKGTYRQGHLTCSGLVSLRIRLEAGREVITGTIAGTGVFDDGAVTVGGPIDGSFLHAGDRQEFTGEVRGDVQAAWDGIAGKGEGILALTLTEEGHQLGLTLSGESRWAAASGELVLPASTWSQSLTGERRVIGDGRLTILQAPWAAAIEGRVGLTWGDAGAELAVQGQGHGRVAGIVPWQGAVSADFVGGWWQVITVTAEPAEVDALALTRSAPLTLEAATLPDGRPWWRTHIGGPVRRLEVCGTVDGDRHVARWRLHDPERPMDVVRPLHLLPAAGDDPA